MRVDLETFYSEETIDEWKQIIGDDLHYHFGYFRGNEDLETGLRQTVQNFYPHIPIGSRVLDVGCGWGGPAKMLKNERHCAVQGLTISSTQVAYCRRIGLDVWRCDIEQEALSAEYDIVFMLEVLSHIRDKQTLLTKLRSVTPRLILSMNCVADIVGSRSSRIAFGGSMEMMTESEFVALVEQAGWHIISKQNRRFQSLATLIYWKKNFQRVYSDGTPPGQLGVLRRLTETALQSPVRWCQMNPLIDLVAEG